MPAAEHPTAADLQSFANGALADEAARSVESHLADCESCLAVAVAAPDDTLVTLFRSAETSQSGPVTPGTAFAETVGLSRTDSSVDADRPLALADHPKYRLIRPLGRGGMGHVWLAEHTLMNRPVALKVVRPEYLDKPEAVERFRREVRAAAKLSHPNIVAAHDAEQAGGTHFLVMEYIDGETLAERIEAGLVSVADACRWTIDAARGLDHARVNGLIHRDMKPHNLIRERATGRVKVLDFGLAGVSAGEVSGLTGGNMVIGTPDYIAPEQAEDARTADTRSDVYSLGCTLYHLLAGRPPFRGESVLKKLDAHRTQQPVPLTTIRQDMTPALAELAARMLAKNPADRPQTPGEVAVALENILAGRGGEPPAPARRRWGGGGRWRRRWRRVAIGALVLLGVLGAVVYKLTDVADVSVSNEAPDQVKWVIKKDGYIVSEPSSALLTGLFLPAGGEYTVELDRPDEFVAFPKSFAVRRGENLTIRVVRVAPAPQLAAVGPVGPPPAPFTLIGKLDGPWTELLPYVDVVADRERGELAREELDGMKVLRVKDIGGGASVRMPVRPDGHYEIRARIARMDGDDSFNLMLPIPGTAGATQVGLYLDGRKDGGTSGLEWEDGPFLPIGKTDLKGRMKTGRAYDLFVWVKTEAGRVGVHAELDGIPVFWWDGAAKDYRRGVNIATKDSRYLGFGASRGAFRVDRFGFRMLTGSAPLGRPAPSAPTPERPRELAGSADAPWTDLLHRLNIPTSRLDGTWGFEGGIQTTSLIAGDAKAKGGKLALPVWPKGDYELRVRFARTAGNDCLTVMLPVPDSRSQAPLVVGGHTPQGGFVGLEYVNGVAKGSHLMNSLGKPLANNTVYTLLVRVKNKDRMTFVTADIDETNVFKWAGPANSLTPRPNWFVPDPTQIALGVWDNCKFRIDSVEFRPLSGSAIWKPGPGESPVTEKPGQVRRFGRYRGVLANLVLSPDGADVFVADAGVSRWNVQTGVMAWENDRTVDGIVALSGDGKVLTVCGEDNVVRVLDPENGKLVRQFAIPPEPRGHVVLSKDGSRAVVSFRKTDMNMKPVVGVWDMAQGKELFRLNGHTDDTYGIALSPDGTRVATASDDGTVRLWDAKDGKELHVFHGHAGDVSAVAFSPDGSYLVSGGVTQTIRIWSIAEKRTVSVLTGHTERLADVAFTPDGTRVVSASGFEGKGDGVRVWDWRTGDLLHHYAEVRGSIGAVAVTPDGRYAVTGEHEGAVRVWRLPPPPAPKADTVGPVRRFGRFLGSAQCVAFSRDGRYVYSLDADVVKWDRETEKVVWIQELNSEGSYQLAVSRNDRHVLAGCVDGTVRVLDADTGKELRRFTKHARDWFGLNPEGIQCLAISPDGKRAVSCSGTEVGGRMHSIRVWEIETLKELFELKGHIDETWCVTYSNDGTQIATASDDGTVRLWDAQTGKELHVFRGHKGLASAVAFSPDGKRLVSGGQDLVVRIWDIEKKIQIDALEGHDVWITEVAYTPDGTRIISASGNWDRGISDGLRVWDARTLKPLYEGVRKEIHTVGLAAAPDNRYAVTGGGDGSIRVWRLPDAPPEKK